MTVTSGKPLLLLRLPDDDREVPPPDGCWRRCDLFLQLGDDDGVGEVLPVALDAPGFITTSTLSSPRCPVLVSNRVRGNGESASLRPISNGMLKKNLAPPYKTY